MTLRNLVLAASGAVLALSGAAMVTPAASQDQPLSILTSFRVGDEGVRCSAQNSPTEKRLVGMFDRAYRLTCRDAAGDVGKLLVLRDAKGVKATPESAGEGAQCAAPEEAIIEQVGEVTKHTCNEAKFGVAYRSYTLERDGRTYLVEGLAGYDPVLRLALASVINDRPLPGKIEVAQTEVSDAAAFARVQAGALNEFDALNEAYVRNNSGRFAESGQFFENLLGRTQARSSVYAEVLANQGLQQSNLGNFQAAEALFARADESLTRSDGVPQRLIRNYRAINFLNRRFPEAALEALAQPMREVSQDAAELSIREGFIDNPLSAQINRENIALQRLGGVELGLSQAERAELLDAQADAISGSIARQQGNLDEASRLLVKADARIAAVREGRVASARWLRSEIAIERALVAEGQGRNEVALRAYDVAANAIGRDYPQSPVLLAAIARKAGFLLRIDREQEARALYATVVKRASDTTDSGASLRNLLEPYFSLLADQGTADATAEFFAASQLLQRPGVAQTQAILARQMSEGDDEASALFRLSLNRSREIARTQARADRLAALKKPTQLQIEGLAAARETLEYLRAEQTGLLSKLADFPRFKALSPTRLELAELQSELKADEAYYKMVILGDEVYSLWITAKDAKSFRMEGGLRELDDAVAFIRDSIVVYEGGETVTYPFDVERARDLYLRLFSPIEDEMKSAKHIIFEPDGPMLQLPPQVLVASQEGVDAYLDRTANTFDDDELYDYREVDWLGKSRDVSIAVSPRGFLNIRRIAPSKAEKAYLGIGSNALPTGRTPSDDPCAWGLDTWRDPIDPGELFFAAGRYGEANSDVAVGDAFTDTALLANDELSEYRVVHFATHGLVTAPKPNCPARPALVTSFGGEGSDGLLSFKEIFDLRLDADVVILSACDTAGVATAAASREAGVIGGGNYALDGLVRAFVGAGARAVVASHWPVPDDFDATQRLIQGLITDQDKGLSVSLGASQRELMADANTSHPFYWAAFIVLGDGTKPIGE
ncbi:CHAT domain-containing protein [Erythrobacter sp. SCSIO 43205]|uniref:CHAT domain-containing protein n=1 Tax=Erythrobacter sp. SCSIO 43205 TaxID=2779361 RepID=UPI001CA86BA1|nr:CHAT domain-containing protein [Erythrobacter sp. SCSIO 43205]UAB78758.1 CHAT domain-containing protein [Erythrobacter sp. SCSIO 43205]